MKKLILIALSIYIASCASTKKGSDEDAGMNEPTPQTVSEMPVESQTSESQPEEKVTPIPVAVSMYAALNDGIKTQNDEAITKASTEILTQSPKDARALNSLAIINYKKGRFEAAQFLLNKAIQANGSTSELYSNLGLVQLAKNERREAVKSFRKALDINPQDAVAGANLGSIYIKERDFNKAVFALEIPVKKGLKDPKIMNNYAIALTATGKGNDAKDIYEKLLKENPSHREAMLNYAILLIDVLQKNKEGLDLLNRLKFVGAPQESRDTIKNLENKAKAGLQ